MVQVGATEMIVSEMNLSQLGATEDASPVLARQAGGEDFGQLFQSTLDESTSSPDRESQMPPEDQGESGRDSTTGDEASLLAQADRVEDRTDESVVDGARVAAIALAAASARVEVGEAPTPEPGRLSDLEIERSSFGQADRGRETLAADQNGTTTEAAGRGRMSAEQAAIAAATVEANSVRESVDPRATPAVEAALTGPGRTRLAQSMPETVESGRGSLEEVASRLQGLSGSRDDNQSGMGGGSHRDGGDRQELGRALFERQEGMGRNADVARSQEIASSSGPALVPTDPELKAPDSIALEGAGMVSNPVAGTATEMTTSVPPGAGASPASASEAISVQTEWLARQGGGTARILLSPPSLGEVAIHVTLRGGNVDVVMVVNEAAAHSVAENQSDRLAQAFSNHDLRMESFEVRRGNPQDTPNGDLGQFSGSESSDHDGDDDREMAERGFGSTSIAGSAVPDVGGIEKLEPPREVSAGSEASVDLRI